jgi:hypothetical protein
MQLTHNARLQETGSAALEPAKMLPKVAAVIFHGQGHVAGWLQEGRNDRVAVLVGLLLRTGGIVSPRLTGLWRNRGSEGRAHLEGPEEALLHQALKWSPADPLQHDTCHHISSVRVERLRTGEIGRLARQDLPSKYKALG